MIDYRRDDFRRCRRGFIGWWMPMYDWFSAADAAAMPDAVMPMRIDVAWLMMCFSADFFDWWLRFSASISRADLPFDVITTFLDFQPHEPSMSCRDISRWWNFISRHFQNIEAADAFVDVPPPISTFLRRCWCISDAVITPIISALISADYAIFFFVELSNITKITFWFLGFIDFLILIFFQPDISLMKYYRQLMMIISAADFSLMMMKMMKTLMMPPNDYRRCESADEHYAEHADYWLWNDDYFRIDDGWWCRNDWLSM